MRHAFVRLSVAVLLSACLDPVPPKPPLNVTVTATPVVAAVGQAVTFVVNAQGNDLRQVGVFYGDGATDVVETGGATTARIEFGHAYTAAGTYDVIGRAVDGVEGQRDVTTQVTVQ
jgi:hypothetical protein